MNEHGFIHTPWFYRPVVEKVNYENLKTETIISCNCLQEKEVFFPLENFTMPQMRYLSLRFPYNLAKEKKKKNKPPKTKRQRNLSNILHRTCDFQIYCVWELRRYQKVLAVKQFTSTNSAFPWGLKILYVSVFTTCTLAMSDFSNYQNDPWN